MAATRSRAPGGGGDDKVALCRATVAVNLPVRRDTLQD
jgi:hypothetical protein